MGFDNHALERIRVVVRRHGVLGTLRLALRTLRHWVHENTPSRRREWQRRLAFDRKHGIDTEIQVSSSALRPPDPGGMAALHAVAYQATSVEALHGILRAIPLRFEDFTFIDIGAGKGRALLIASHYPFRRIIGVEFSPRLVEVAKRNIARYRDPEQKSRAMECVCMDAASYPLPADGNLLLYLYNPFGEPIMRAFLDGVARAAGRDDREIWIVYANAVHRDLFDRSSFLSPVENAAGLCLYRARNTVRAA